MNRPAGRLTTHVLDTARGCPAAGMIVTLVCLDRDHEQKTITLNSDGRAGAPLLEGDDLLIGRYRLVFEVADYFRSRGVALHDPPFLDRVPVEFAIADADASYHVPLLVSPWSYSTYRGS
jgi:5-hydroxyisourate hydrolase